MLHGRHLFPAGMYKAPANVAADREDNTHPVGKTAGEYPALTNIFWIDTHPLADRYF
jgi:hypothetical protein